MKWARVVYKLSGDWYGEESNATQSLFISGLGYCQYFNSDANRWADSNCVYIHGTCKQKIRLKDHRSFREGLKSAGIQLCHILSL